MSNKKRPQEYTFPEFQGDDSVDALEVARPTAKSEKEAEERVQTDIERRADEFRKSFRRDNARNRHMTHPATSQEDDIKQQMEENEGQ